MSHLEAGAGLRVSLSIVQLNQIIGRWTAAVIKQISAFNN